MAADDWSLTPATLARVAELPTPDVPDPDALGAKALESLDAGARYTMRGLFARWSAYLELHQHDTVVSHWP